MNCTATGVKVDYLNLSLYGFAGGVEKVQLTAFDVIVNSSLLFNYTEEYSYDVLVPTDVWGPIYTDMHLKISVSNLDFKDNPSFSITTVRNIYYEKLQENFKNLNESYSQLNSTFWQLKNLFDELNSTYWKLTITILPFREA